MSWMYLPTHRDSDYFLLLSLFWFSLLFFLRFDFLSAAVSSDRLLRCLRIDSSYDFFPTVSDSPYDFFATVSDSSDHCNCIPTAISSAWTSKILEYLFSMKTHLSFQLSFFSSDWRGCWSGGKSLIRMYLISTNIQHRKEMSVTQRLFLDVTTNPPSLNEVNHILTYLNQSLTKNKA